MAEINEKRPFYTWTLMFLLDSNIIIYAALGNDLLIEFTEANSPFVSDISRVEILGFQRITQKEIKYFDTFFGSATLLNVSEAVILEAIKIRQTRKIAIADALIAATAIAHDLVLVTRNTKDFKTIESLELIDPLAEQ